MAHIEGRSLNDDRPFAEIKTTFANFAFLLATFARFSPKNVSLSRSFCEFLIFWIRSKNNPPDTGHLR